MVNDIFNGIFKLFLLIATILILFTWSIGLFSAGVLILPLSVIALIGLLTARPFRETTPILFITHMDIVLFTLSSTRAAE